MATARTIEPPLLVERPGEEIPLEGVRRQPELDALRLLVIFGLIPVHAAQILADSFGFWVKDDPSFAFFIFVSLAAFWAMPLLFLTSGMTLWYALRKAYSP
jgi:hypothetical protein